MGYQVIFSPTAIRDLADSVSYISRHDPETAARIGDGIIDSAERILSAEYPDSEVRYLLHRDYRIVYEVHESHRTVSVLRIWHCAKGDWPVDLD